MYAGICLCSICNTYSSLMATFIPYMKEIYGK